MKKTLIFILTISLLCGCASQNNSNSKDVEDETETTAVTTTVQVTSISAVTAAQTVTTTISTTTAVTTTTSEEEDEDFVWLEKGVYEYGHGERDYDLPYDNRFQGEFYSFFDENHGVTWDAYEGITTYFTCEQKKEKIIFHITNLTKNNSQAGIGISYDGESKPSLDDDGNVRFSDTSFLVKLPATVEIPNYGGELCPEMFDARDFRDNYVPLGDDRPQVLGCTHYLGKKIEE